MAKGKGQPAQHSGADVTEEEEEEEDDGEIRCVCGEETDKGLMIQCEKCLVWQHGACMDIKHEDQVPDNWFCELCQRQLELNRPCFSFLNDSELVAQFDADFRKLEQHARQHPQETIRSLSTDIGLDLLEKYALKFGRNKTKPGTDQIYIKALSLLFGCTEEHVGENFSQIADEIAALAPPEETPRVVDDGPYAGWRKEVTNVYPKAGAKRPPNCQDPSCDCVPFRKAAYAPVHIQKRKGEYSLLSESEIQPETLIIEYIGELLDAAMVKRIAREDAETIFDHDIPYVLFASGEDGKEACVDARRRGNIARYIHQSCTPNARVEVKKAHGRTYMGIYAQKVIPPGAMITIPFQFQFPGKNFKSTARCFCTNEDCSVAKWYKHRSSQVVRRLKVAITLLSADEDIESIKTITSPIRRSQSRQEKMKRERLAQGTQQPHRRAKTGSGRRTRMSKDAAEESKLQPKTKKRRKESRASLRAAMKQSKMKELAQKPSKMKREDSKKTSALRTKKLSATRRKDSISPAYTQLVLDIELLRKALKRPVRSATLVLGKKRALLLKNEERKRKKQILAGNTGHIVKLPMKKNYSSRVNLISSTSSSIAKPIVTNEPKIPPPIVNPVVVEITTKTAPVSQGIAITPPREEEVVSQTPPPSPPRINPVQMGRGIPVYHDPIPHFGDARNIPSAATYQPKTMATMAEDYARRNFNVEQRSAEKEKLTLLGIPSSRNCWDDGPGAPERKNYSPPRERSNPRGHPVSHVPLRRSEMAVTHAATHPYRTPEPSTDHDADNMDIDEEGTETNNILFVNRGRHNIPPSSAVPQDHRSATGYIYRGSVPHHNTGSSRNWGPPRGPSATRREDYYRRPMYKRR